jgi:hypothetical protein
MHFKNTLPILSLALIGFSPISNGDILQDTLGLMTPNSWVKININEFQDVWTPPELRPTPDSPHTNILSWSGAAWDPNRKSMYIWGGDIGNEQGNEVYIFNAATGFWGRGSLPSQITGETLHTQETLDGWEITPVSGESWDNVVFLKNSDRMAVFGVSRSGWTFVNLDQQETGTGPYFWDPSRADPDKVSGASGTGVNPDTIGGNMWSNRDQWSQWGLGVNIAQRGTTAYTQLEGKDVVLFSDANGNL